MKSKRLINLSLSSQLKKTLIVNTWLSILLTAKLLRPVPLLNNKTHKLVNQTK